jgi:hypothetical protein
MGATGCEGYPSAVSCCLKGPTPAADTPTPLAATVVPTYTPTAADAGTTVDVGGVGSMQKSTTVSPPTIATATAVVETTISSPFFAPTAPSPFPVAAVAAGVGGGVVGLIVIVLLVLAAFRQYRKRGSDVPVHPNN